MATEVQDYEVAQRLQVARNAAERAGKITLKFFQTDFERQTKADGTVVTIADRKSEQQMRKMIETAFPHDAILGEEFGEKPGQTRYRWILDPIDGTLSFAQGVPLYGVLVGLEDLEDGRSVLGVIHLPPLGETVYARRGGGCHWERHVGRKRTSVASRVSRVDKLEHAILLATDFWNVPLEDRRQALARLTGRTRLQRTWADCYGYALVATGRAELMLDSALNVWDSAPMQPILEEAGGTFTDWSGKPTIHGDCGLATNGLLLEEALAVMQEPPPLLGS